MCLFCQMFSLYIIPYIGPQKCPFKLFLIFPNRKIFRYAIPKLYNVVKYWNELFSAEKNYIHNKLVSSAVIRSQNTKIKNKINIHFAFSERPDPHQLKFVQVFSSQPISNYFTLQGYIASFDNNYIS